MLTARFWSASSRSRARSLPNDTRCFATPTEGLYAVVDARGPTYGGWHRPCGPDAAWSALVSSVQKTGSTTLLNAIADGLRDANSAALSADPDWQHRSPGAALSHPALSICLVAFGPCRAVAAGVGNCRVYLRRAERWSIVVPEQTLATAHPEIDLPKEMTGEAAQVLGLRPSVVPHFWSDDPQPDDVFLLCTQEVWDSCADDIPAKHVAPDRLLETLPPLVDPLGGNASACVVTPHWGHPAQR